ncbi:MAG TPA: sulfurtransferase TusA family protein [Thermoplasmata archaeon]|nr:sulfurtransferase TusA family protein [Thermoplasmata archaeon]
MEILGCPLPEDRLYDLDMDVWWAEEPARGTARVGVLASLSAFAGPIQSLSFRPAEARTLRGRSVATVESLRFTGAIRLPVDGAVVARNERVRERPRLLNDAPYTEGWIVEVRADRPEDVSRYLEPASAVVRRLEERILSRRIRCWPQTPELELNEVGLECSAVLTRLNEELARRAPGEAVLLVTDDPTSPVEMVRWSDETGHPVLAQRKEGSLFQFLVRRDPNPVPRRPRAPRP